MANSNNFKCPLMGRYLFCHLDDDGEGPLYQCIHIGEEDKCPANIVKQSENNDRK